ncbi:MAG: hypothetical protein IH945_09440 [Armatimonadetes bacterium]|nr:hypothetical protein [Armatimonadota bacterium]
MRQKTKRKYRVKVRGPAGGFGSRGENTVHEVIQEHVEGEQPEGAVLVEDGQEPDGAKD